MSLEIPLSTPLIEIEPLTEFFDAIKSPLTKDHYRRHIAYFFEHAKLEGDDLKSKARSFEKKAKKDPQWATASILDYMRWQKSRAEKKEISAATLANYSKPIRVFCDQNDILLNWKKISSRIPKGARHSDDARPTLEQIRTLLGYPDRRIKPSILFMASGGFRLGAWDTMRWKHVVPVGFDLKGRVVELRHDIEGLVAAQVLIYPGDSEEYSTFVTPEAYRAMKEWVDFRASHGEKITGESFLMRDLWNSTSKAGRGLASQPQPLKSSGLKRMIERALFAQGIRSPLRGNSRRHEFKTDHGFRKFFKSTCERSMKSLHTEMLLGHSTGLAESYYRPEPGELLREYMKAIPELTILEKPPQIIIHGGEDLRAEIERMKAEQARKDVQSAEILQKLAEEVKAMREERRKH